MKGGLFMSLKQECIDMFRLIMDGMNECEDYQIEEPSGVFLCPKEDYKDIDTLIIGCEKCLVKNNCSKELVKVDLSIFVPSWAGEEDGGGIYICFNQKPVKEQYKNTIHYINNRRQLLDFMIQIKNRAESTRNAYAEYAEKIIELREYGKVFLEQLKTDYSVFADIKAELPIVFADFQKDESGKYVYDIGGNFEVVNDVQIIIHVFDCWRDIESLKMTLRHEILHYLLFIVSVNNLDDGGIFHYFCDKYNAHAYKEMPKKEREIYNAMMKGTNEEVSKALENIKRKIILGYAEGEKQI